jgi:hypothetical protein
MWLYSSELCLNLQAVLGPVYIFFSFTVFEAYTKGPITWRTFNPGVELSPVNRIEIFCDYMDDFNPGFETLYYTFLALIRGSKKSFYFVFL